MNQVKSKNLPVSGVLGCRASECARLQIQEAPGERLTIITTVIRTHADFAVGSTVDSTGEAHKAL